MRELKKLTCGINLANIVGKPYEKNIIDLLLYICEDAQEIKANQIEYTFYYNGNPTEADAKKFLDNFKDYDKFIKILNLFDYSPKGIWYSILTKEELNLAGRTCHIINEVTQESLTRALLEYYSKAKLQIKISMGGKK